MRLEWLEDLLAVAETGSFQEAADRRRLTQSAFSRRIQHIEDQIGVELFDRSRKPVQPLPAMQQQRDQMARLAAELRQLGNDLRRGERMATNRIVIASQHALTTALAPPNPQDHPCPPRRHPCPAAVGQSGRMLCAVAVAAGRSGAGLPVSRRAASDRGKFRGNRGDRDG